MPVCIWKASLPSGNAKIGYKTHSPPRPTGSPVYKSPPHSPICSLSLSFLQLNSLQIKSFQPLWLESVVYAFILRAGSRTLSTWNSCACHPCIIFGDHKGTNHHLRSVQVVPHWERLPRNVTKSVWHSGGICFPGENPHHGLATVELSGQPFLPLSLSC
jgi:hypothetical protein